MVTAQGPVPEQVPLQLTNDEPELGTGARVTVLCCGKALLQLLVQEMPLGNELTEPCPITLTERLNVDGGATTSCVVSYAP